MRLPLEVQRTLHQALTHVAANPGQSVTSTLPDRPGRMIRVTHEHTNGLRETFVVVFQFTADEKYLHVYDIHGE